MRFRHPLNTRAAHVTLAFNVISYPYKFTPHKGIDYRAKTGSPVFAVADGKWKVVKDEGKKGYGMHVILEHADGYETVYAHLSGTTYSPGFVDVKAGDVVGYVGNSGWSTGPHLHFEARHNGIAIDPDPLIRAGYTLVNFIRAKSMIRVEDKGQIVMPTLNGLIEVTKENCWDVITDNAHGISEKNLAEFNALTR